MPRNLDNVIFLYDTKLLYTKYLANQPYVEGRASVACAQTSNEKNKVQRMYVSTSFIVHAVTNDPDCLSQLGSIAPATAVASSSHNPLYTTRENSVSDRHTSRKFQHQHARLS